MNSQQSAEKAIKAALLLEKVDFPLVHDLDILRSLLPSGWAVRDAHDDLYELSGWTIEARYPGDWPEPTTADAIGAESKARVIYESIEAEFKRRDVLN